MSTTQTPQQPRPTGLVLIEQEMKTKANMSQLVLAMGFDAENPKGREKAMRCISSVLLEIKKSAADPKKDLTGCNPQSIVQATIDAARLDVMIDGRQHAHLVKYGNSVQLQVGYRGFLAKITEHFPDADFCVEPVYEGDDVKVWSKDGNQHYELIKKAAFKDGESGFKGILFAVRYTSNGRLITKANDVSKSRVDRARKAAKQDFIWTSDYIEKAKAAAIKASSKVMFASLQGLQDMIRYDNDKNFDVGKLDEDTDPATEAATSSAASTLQTMNEKLNGGPVIEGESREIQAEAEQEIIPPTEEKKPTMADKLRKAESAIGKCVPCDGFGSVKWVNGDESGIEPCDACKGTGKSAS